MRSISSFQTWLALAAVAGSAAAQDPVETDRPTPPPANQPGLALPTPFVSTSFITGTTVRTVFCSIATESTSDVPGVPGVKFAGTSVAFDRPYGTKNGHWILRTDTDAATTADAMLLVDGVVGAREGDAASFSAGNTIGPFEIRNGINESGNWAFKNNVAPSTTNDDYVVHVAGATQTVVAQEAATIGAFPPTVTWDDTITSVLLLDNDDVGMEGDGIDGTGITTSTDEAYVVESIGGTDVLLAQEGVTQPAGQLGGGTDLVENIDFEDVWFTQDGAHNVWKGDLLGATTVDQVVVYDGTVVLQEGFDIPGGPYVADPIDASGIVEVAMDQAGNWWARGNNETETDWVVRNGVVMAKEGDPIFATATELWDDTTFSDLFFAHQGDSRGNYVIAGVTDAADILANAVMVLNNTTVIARENDPIDLDNNGLFDDSAWINTFGNDDLILNDLGELYFVCTIRNLQTSTTSVGQALIKVQALPGPFAYCTAGTTTNNCVPAIAGIGFPSATSGADFTIAIDQVEGDKQGLIFYGISGPAAAAWGTSSSFLCVKSPTQRTPAQSTGGVAGTCDGVMSIDWNAYIATHPTAVGVPFSAGDTVHAQGWFRDPASPKTTNLSDGLEFIVGP